MNRILAAIDFSDVTAEVISKAVALQKAVRGQLCITIQRPRRAVDG